LVELDAVGGPGGPVSCGVEPDREPGVLGDRAVLPDCDGDRLLEDRRRPRRGGPGKAGRDDEGREEGPGGAAEVGGGEGHRSSLPPIVSLEKVRLTNRSSTHLLDLGPPWTRGELGVPERRVLYEEAEERHRPGGEEAASPPHPPP